MEKRNRAYRRYRRHLAIVHKKGVSRRIYGRDYFSVDGKYSKGHIGCGCQLCKPEKRFKIVPGTITEEHNFIWNPLAGAFRKKYGAPFVLRNAERKGKVTRN